MRHQPRLTRKRRDLRNFDIVTSGRQDRTAITSSNCNALSAIHGRNIKGLAIVRLGRFSTGVNWFLERELVKKCEFAESAKHSRFEMVFKLVSLIGDGE